MWCYIFKTIHDSSKKKSRSSQKCLKEHAHQVSWSSCQKCGNTSELKKGAVSKILFPINIGVNGASESYSGRSEADDSKTVNPTEKVDTLWERRQVWLQLWQISLFLRVICGRDCHGKRTFLSFFLVSLTLSVGVLHSAARTFRHTHSLKTLNFPEITHHR